MIIIHGRTAGLIRCAALRDGAGEGLKGIELYVVGAERKAKDAGMCARHSLSYLLCLEASKGIN
jgi:hypothetical protein